MIPAMLVALIHVNAVTAQTTQVNERALKKPKPESAMKPTT